MKTKFLLPLFALLSAILLWTVVTWPLASLSTRAVAAAPTNFTDSPPQAMIAGDHLQMLYHLWLGHDTFFGPTPWATNVYEFNVGSDEDLRAYSTYYFPFNFFYSIGYLLGGFALGMNVAVILSLFISIWATAVWLRRWFPNNPALILFATLLGQALPYRWHTLMNGSPTGLSMMWVPVLLLGIDKWIRDRSRLGAFYAGAAVFLSGWSDSHVFFFSGMLSVAAMIPALLLIRERIWPSKEEFLGWLKSAWPLFLWVALVLFQAWKVTEDNKDRDIAVHGRPPSEVALFSPHLEEAFDFDHWGGAVESYLGWLPLLVLIAGLGFWIWRIQQGERSSWKYPVAILLYSLGMLMILLVATGVHNPFGLIWWQRLCKLLPPLGLIRQPAKVYLLLPPILSLLMLLSFQSFPQRFRTWICLGISLLVGLSFVQRIHPRISLIDLENSAYAAVAAQEEDAQALALPLWPGNAHWSSLYTHSAMLHRVRMVNGYNPAPRVTYIDEVFKPYAPLNQGMITDTLLNGLQEMGVEHLILHENAFPQKVSAFAVGDTLRAMLTHPRLRFLEQDRSVWAFEILAASEAETPPEALRPPWQNTGASLHREIEHNQIGDLVLLEDPRFFAGKAVEFAEAHPPLQLLDIHGTLPWPRKIWLVGEGEGELRFRWKLGEQEGEQLLSWESNSPAWRALELPASEGEVPIQLSVEWHSGKTVLDFMSLTTESWNPNIDEPLTLYPGEWFHAGFTHNKSWELHLDPERESADAILYGPGLPLAVGSYSLRAQFSSEAPEGTLLGTLRLRHMGLEREVELRQGEEAQLKWEQPGNRWFMVEFEYSGLAPMQIQGFELQQESDSPAP